MLSLVKRFIAEENGDFIQYLIVALVIALGVFAVSGTIRTALQGRGTAVETGVTAIN